jgi:WD40 domain-containing protein
VRLFAIPSGQETAPLVGHKRDVSGISFSPDGRTLATISDDGTARLWHVATWRELVRFPTPMKDPRGPGLMFSPDGRALVTQTEDTGGGVVRTWYAPSYDELALVEGKENEMPRPRDVTAWHVRGKALEKLNRDEEAVQAFSEVIQQSAGRPELEALRTSAFQHRAQVLIRIGRFAEAGADNCSALNVPPRDPRTPSSLIDLSPYFSGPLDRDSLYRNIPFYEPFPTLPRGRQTLPGSRGLEFDLRGIVQLDNGGFPGLPRAVEGIAVRQKYRRLHFLHATYHSESEDKAIGAYVVHYADGTQEEIPIRYGKDTLDWYGEGGDLPAAKVAWRGSHSRSAAIRLFNRTWENPRSEMEIRTLDFISKMTKCAPFLIAITAEP